MIQRGEFRTIVDTTSQVSSTLYYWWLDLKGEQDTKCIGERLIDGCVGESV